MHPEREAVNRSLVHGAPFRRIAAQFGLAETSLRRHAASHVPKLLSDAAEEEERVTAGALLADLRRLQSRAEQILDRWEGADDRLALQAIRELRGLVATSLRGVETAELEERVDALEYHHTLHRPRNHDFA
jgi:transposase-like protein